MKESKSRQPTKGPCVLVRGWPGRNEESPSSACLGGRDGRRNGLAGFPGMHAQRPLLQQLAEWPTAALRRQ